MRRNLVSDSLWGSFLLNDNSFSENKLYILTKSIIILLHNSGLIKIRNVPIHHESVEYHIGIFQ